MSIPSASLYGPGTANYTRVQNAQGTDAANAQWQSAITAEQNQTPLDTSTWDAFGNQIYNDPLGAPLAQAGKVAGNSFTALGNAAKTAFSSAIGNWGMWIVVIILLVGAFFYLGGASVVRRRVSKL